MKTKRLRLEIINEQSKGSMASMEDSLVEKHAMVLREHQVNPDEHIR